MYGRFYFQEKKYKVDYRFYIVEIWNIRNVSYNKIMVIGLFTIMTQLLLLLLLLLKIIKDFLLLLLLFWHLNFF